MKEDITDRIRVDLLKFRRKAYLAYPEGSQERKNFLKTILQNELSLTLREVPQDLINLVVEGDRFVFWSSIRQFLGWFGLSLLFGAAFISIPASYCFLFLPLAIGTLAVGMHYLYDYWLFYKGVKKVQRYSNDMQKHINKISNDIKRLDGPR